MENAELKSDDDQIKSAIISTVVSAAGITVISYIIGFLVINSFFIFHGVVLYNLLSPQYLATGIVFIFFYGITAIIFVVHPSPMNLYEKWDIMVKDRNQAEQELEEKIKSGEIIIPGFHKFFPIVYAISSFMGYFTGYFTRFLRYNGVHTLLFLVPLSFIIYYSRSDLQLFYSPYFYLWTFVVIIGFNLILDFSKQTEKRKWLLLIWILFLLLLSAMLYGRYVYPHVSSSLGGGIPLEVQFIVDSTNKDLLNSTLNIKVDSNTTPIIKLIFETSDSYIVLVDRNQAEQIVQFKKELVKGVIYQAIK